MLARVLACLMGLALTVTSTATASIAYLCVMDGGVHDECCCSPPKPPREDRVERAQDNACCVLQTTTPSHPPARAEAGPKTLLPPALAALRLPEPVAPGAGVQATHLPGARGPPVRGAPALFLRHCSFLI